MTDSDFSRLGREMQIISESQTFAEYRKVHPSAKVGFFHNGDALVLTLTHAFGKYRGVVKYANNADELIELAHLALCEARGIDVH